MVVMTALGLDHLKAVMRDSQLRIWFELLMEQMKAAFVRLSLGLKLGRTTFNLSIINSSLSIVTLEIEPFSIISPLTLPT